jgi:hypothetical protein
VQDSAVASFNPRVCKYSFKVSSSKTVIKVSLKFDSLYYRV